MQFMKQFIAENLNCVSTLDRKTVIQTSFLEAVDLALYLMVIQHMKEAMANRTFYIDAMPCLMSQTLTNILV